MTNLNVSCLQHDGPFYQMKMRPPHWEDEGETNIWSHRHTMIPARRLLGRETSEMVSPAHAELRREATVCYHNRFVQCTFDPALAVCQPLASITVIDQKVGYVTSVLRAGCMCLLYRPIIGKSARITHTNSTAALTTHSLQLWHVPHQH